MNLGLILLLVSALKATARWPWYALGGVSLGVLSLEWQALSALGLTISVAGLALVHAAALGLLISRADARRRLVSRVRASLGTIREKYYAIGTRSRAVLVVSLGCVVAVLAIRALLFLPEAADPYHLVRVWTLTTNGSLRPTASEDYKINALGYLYELALVDGTFGSTAMQAWIGLQGPVLFLGYVLVIGWAVARRSSITALGLLLACLVPPVFHQGVLVKNDLFAALLAIPALVLLYEFTATTIVASALWIGVLAGLAASVKVTTATMLLPIALFLPWLPASIAVRSRVAAAGGFLAGILAGGLGWVVVHNLTLYGSVAGPMGDTGNSTESLPAALVSLFRFVVSWFDLTLATRQIWPGRGGWGGAFGPALVWAIGVLVFRAGQDHGARRALGIALCGLLPFGMIYPDADLAHRMALAPAVFAIVAAVWSENARNTLKTWTPIALAAGLAVAASGALLARSSLAYIRQVEYLRSSSAALTVGNPTQLAHTPVWQLRQANASLAGASRVCSVMQENMLALRDHDFEPMVVTKQHRNGFAHEWQPDARQRCDAVVVGPNTYPEPPPLVAAWLQRCLGSGSATGLDVEIRARRCDRPSQ
jgi:hypothetical protein